MVFAWVGAGDEVVEAPLGMVSRTNGKVRRRSWLGCVRGSSRTYELSAYLGLDEELVPLIRWDCQVWLHGQPLDYMASATRHYGYRPAPVEMLDELVAELTPDEVTGYAVWGSLLVGVRSQ